MSESTGPVTWTDSRGTKHTASGDPGEDVVAALDAMGDPSPDVGVD